jgi:four helix bundle protein
MLNVEYPTKKSDTCALLLRWTINGVPEHTARCSCWGVTYDLEERLIAFAASVCALTRNIPYTTIGRHISSQITRCSTSPLANYGEAQAAESLQDFIHKLRICLKELRETNAWLKFVARMQYAPHTRESVQAECNELISIVVASIKTANKRKART